MKSINRIMILTLAAILIVKFWLMPGINKATAMQYTRVYEDTDHLALVAKDTSKHEKKVKPPKGPGRPEDNLKQEKYPSGNRKPSKKVYKSESIRPKDKKARLNARMFSRAVQFVEEVPLDSTEAVVVADSVSTTPF